LKPKISYIPPKEADQNGDSCKEGAILCVELEDLDAALENYCEAVRYYKISKNTDKLALCYKEIIELLKECDLEQKNILS